MRSLTELQARILGGASAVAIASVAAPALAQNAPAPSEQQQASSDVPADPNALQEIVVQAQRRSERLNDVPIAITAVSGDSLTERGISDVQGLSIAAPALSTTHGTAAPNLFMRGVGNTSFGVGQEQNVAIYVDGIYYPATYANVFAFVDIDHIEVLRGPQGTLFGRNATGGVVQIITKDPSDHLSGSAHVGYGNYDTIVADGYLSAPLTSNLGVNLSARYEKQNDGWGRNQFDGSEVNLEKNLTLRGKLVWNPGDTTKVTVQGGYFFQRSDIGQQVQPLPDVPKLSPAFGSADFSGDVHDSYSNFPSDTKTRQYNASLRVDQDLGFANLVSITGYTYSSAFVRLDSIPGPRQTLILPLTTSSYSQELQLQSPNGSPIQWLAGLFYFNSDAHLTNLSIRVGPAQTQVSSLSGTQGTKSYAAFGQATIPIFDRTSLPLGARYTQDDRQIYGVQNNAPFPSQKKGWGSPTFRVVLDHKFSDKTMVYASFNTGFKSGLYNLPTPLNPPVNPEKLSAFEIGLKTGFFDGRGQLNISAFHYNYRNIQLLKVANVVTILQNAASAEIYGGEAEVQMRVVRGLTLRGALSLQHSRYQSFPGASAGVPGPDGINVGASVDATGNQLLRAPNATVNVGADYTTRASFGTVDANVTFYHNSGFPWEADNRLRQPAYNLVNAGLTFTDTSNRYSLQLWAKNLFNEDYYNVQSSASNGPDVGAGAAPRTYGATLGFKF